MADPFECAVSREIWDAKYRRRDGGRVCEDSVEETWRRVARAVARAERDRSRFEARFFTLLNGFRFLPGGRILAGTGTGRRVTLLNCFVMGRIEDSIDGIFQALKEGAVTMQQGGGVGYDFSTLRPRGSVAAGAGTIASGPVSFMRVWDAMCATILSTGARRGAMMATLRDDHPDVLEFIEAKRDPRELRRFNLSVQVSDALLEAVRRDEEWPLRFNDGAEVLRVRARELWERLLRATYDVAEPGVLFVDRIQRENNLHYRETITATNPCGEIPLPPYGACDLGSFNLTAFLVDPFEPGARFDFDGFLASVPDAVRFLDDVLEVSRFPLSAQRREARRTRRVGLGVTGLADTLAALGLRYDTERARSFAATLLERLRDAAYGASVELAREKGTFPAFERDAYLSSRFVARLPRRLRDAIARHGIRNSHLLAIAPTGTISLLANAVSSGIEPIFDVEMRRRILDAHGVAREHRVVDWAARCWRRLRGDRPLPSSFVRARDLDPEEHLAMQAALQPFVDHSISKTVHVPEDFPFERFRDVYERAHALGLKGCTTWRPNSVTGAVLVEGGTAGESVHCCTLARESD